MFKLKHKNWERITDGKGNKTIFSLICFNFLFKAGTFFSDLTLGSRHGSNLKFSQKFALMRYEGIIFHSWKFSSNNLFIQDNADE